MKLYYYSAGSNFGDAVNPYILENIFGRKSVLAAPCDADLFMIGSILGKILVRKSSIFKRLKMAFSSPLTIWSSGFIRDDVAGKCLSRNLNVCALRGELSLKLLEKISGQKFSPVLGDGGLLIAQLIKELPEKKYPVGIFPHFADENRPEIALLQKKIPGSVVISPLGDPLECARKIAECETVISSSLHGLIASDSFGIPNRQIVISSNIKGGLFKYNDYYSAYKTQARPLVCNDVINNGINADIIRADYRISVDRVAEIKEQLIDSFPREME
ncbi:MAG: polysaccharide pyruvyl transferase family protein [Clostridia bacterium]|nr:polysaccharide pyruvyl transferase family protein [Clostridia bacterium]